VLQIFGIENPEWGVAAGWQRELMHRAFLRAVMAATQARHCSHSSIPRSAGRFGDKVQIIVWPKGLDEDRLHADTRDFYKRLIDSGNVMTIVKIYSKVIAKESLLETELQLQNKAAKR
jgi:hypothetical protein